MVFFTLDLSLEPLYYSESSTEILGYTPKEALALAALAMVHESSQEEVFTVLASYLELEAKQPYMGSVTMRILSKRRDQSTLLTENYVSFL